MIAQEILLSFENTCMHEVLPFNYFITEKKVLKVRKKYFTQN